jgi:hypothetical protein
MSFLNIQRMVFYRWNNKGIVLKYRNGKTGSYEVIAKLIFLLLFVSSKVDPSA